MANGSTKVELPTAGQIRQAVEIYLAAAYGAQRPDRIRDVLPGENFAPAAYLMSDSVERTEQGARANKVRSFALRLGNVMYANMKLRISRVPRGEAFVFSVDSHDAFLQASSGSGDAEALRELKDHNAALARKIESAWDAAGLPTQKAFLRRKIKEAKRGK